MYSDEKIYLTGLVRVPGLGPKRIKKLIKVFGNAEKVWKAGFNELAKIPEIGEKIAGKLIETRESTNLEEDFKYYRNLGIKIFVPGEKGYPFPLASIYDPPPVIFMRGKWLPEDRLAIAVVGSRHNSHYGKRACQELVSEMVFRGITIVSGLARGIDSIAHSYALENGGRTIAVLGSGLDTIYPPENKKLYHSILKNGCVISEFPLGTRPLKQNFPRRNRILSGLAMGTLVIEAAERSGSLITARWALEQGREVFAVPGDIYRLNSQGTNNLIKAGAKIVTCIDDILEEFPSIDFKVLNKDRKEEQPVLPFLTGEENMVFMLINEEPVQLEDLIKKTTLKPGKINSLLLGLELKGVIRELPGKRYVRI